MLGKQTGNSWTPLRISCHSNWIPLSLVSFDPFKSCITSAWMFDFRALCAVSMSDCISQITCNVNYTCLEVWSLGLQNMATLQVTGTQDPIKPSLYLSKPWFPRANCTWYSQGKPCRFQSHLKNLSFSRIFHFLTSGKFYEESFCNFIWM